mmetsp:Transcript_16628/g.34464  ORF Transcript_16628/g.34464 Transcript_16628/m.34464 type:complete len:200 (-) Transcript_16628:235-834(-)
MRSASLRLMRLVNRGFLLMYSTTFSHVRHFIRPLSSAVSSRKTTIVKSKTEGPLSLLQCSGSTTQERSSTSWRWAPSRSDGTSRFCHKSWPRVSLTGIEVRFSRRRTTSRITCVASSVPWRCTGTAAKSCTSWVPESFGVFGVLAIKTSPKVSEMSSSEKSFFPSLPMVGVSSILANSPMGLPGPMLPTRAPTASAWAA